MPDAVSPTLLADTGTALSVGTGTAVELGVSLTISVSVTARIRFTPNRDRRISSTSLEQNRDVHFLPFATVFQWRRVARLARIAVDDDEIVQLCTELNSILSYVDQLSILDVDNVEPMTSVIPMQMKMRTDRVDDGNIVDEILRNAPMTEDHFFVVPKVVE